MPVKFSAITVLDFLKKNQDVYTNTHGIHFQLYGDYLITLSSEISTGVKIQVPFYNPFSLVKTYGITSLGFLKNKITRTHLYETYYLTGQGQISYSLVKILNLSYPEPLDLFFEHIPFHEKTKIYAPKLHFFEELDSGFYEDEQYFDYIRENKHLLEWLFANRHLYQIRKSLGKESNHN
ncbi:MAG: hypothetical protein M0Q26_11000 [Chitinophagaceae bacterium]|nr:hypothetical protein [Chitinophagaceae bacterium]